MPGEPGPVAQYMGRKSTGPPGCGSATRAKRGQALWIDWRNARPPLCRGVHHSSKEKGRSPLQDQSGKVSASYFPQCRSS